MIKKIDFGKTNLSDLHQVFKLQSHDALNERKARLFPSGNTDNEVSTTSIFLASLSAIKEYREELFLEMGISKLKARNATLHAYTEINNSSKEERPDGLIIITSGKHTPVIEWAGFVESKVKDNTLCVDQIERYADFAREIGINDIITISNHLTTTPKDSHLKLKKRSFNLYHWSWTYLKVTGSRLVRTDKIEDEDHVYILKELRRYFDNHKNLSNYVNMGKTWKDSVTTIHGHSIDQKIEATLLQNILDSYIQEEKDVSLQLTDRSKFHVELIDSKKRKEEIEESLQKRKVIVSTFMIDKDKKNKFTVEIDFIRQKIICSTTLAIEKGKARGQTSTLIKMFEDIGATTHILVNAYYLRNKSKKNNIPLSVLIDERTQEEPYSILEKEFGDTVKHFEIRTEDLLGRDFQSVKNFIVKLEDTTKRFLEQVMSNKA
jgi:hypothetical protein